MEQKSFSPLIFIVDDNKSILQLIKKKLETEHFLNLEFFSTYEDLFAAIDKQPNIIVLDNYLTVEASDSERSIEVFMELKSLLPKTVFIIHSGENNPEVIHEYVLKGVYAYIIKDTHSLEKLTDAIQQIVEKISANQTPQ